MLQVYVKDFKTLLFPNALMDLVYIWREDRYWSKVFLSIIPVPIYDMKVNVTDSVCSIWTFTLRFKNIKILQTLGWFWFRYGFGSDTVLDMFVPHTWYDRCWNLFLISSIPLLLACQGHWLRIFIIFSFTLRLNSLNAQVAVTFSLMITFRIQR